MEKKTIQIDNGETIAYLDEGQAKKVMVLVHGNMSSGVHFKPIIEELKKEFRVIAPDMRGFGDSTYNTRLTSLEDLSDDIINLLDKLNISSYSLAGWSTGGAVVMKIAAKRQQQVEKLVLIESCSHRGYPIFRKNEKGEPLIGEYYTNIEELALDAIQVKPMVDVFNAGLTPVMKTVWDSAIYTVNKPSEEDDSLYLSETMKQRNLLDIDWCLTTFNMSNTSNGLNDGDNSIQDVICPVLSFWGDKDIVVLEYMVDETVNAVKDIKKVILENSGHSPLVDCPERLISEMKQFCL